MKKLTVLGFIACVGLLLAPVALAGDPKGPPGGLGVEIVNPLPVPVTGDVQITNTPTVNIDQPQQPWDMKVVNPEDLPVPVKEINHDTCKPKPLHIDNLTQSDTDKRVFYVSLIDEVPEDQVLVIETVSVSVKLRDNLLPAVVRVSAGSWRFIYIPLIESPGLSFSFDPPPYSTWSNTLSTRIYADPGQTVYAELWADKPAPSEYSGIFDVSIWGTYIHADCFANE